MKKFNHNRGFSFLELTISLGIMAGVAAGTGAMITSSMQDVGSQTNEFDSMAMINEIRLEINRPLDAQASAANAEYFRNRVEFIEFTHNDAMVGNDIPVRLRLRSRDSADPLILSQVSGQNTFTSGKSKLKITKLVYANSRRMTRNTAAATSTYTGDLVIAIKKDTPSSALVPATEKYVGRMIVEVNDSGTVVGGNTLNFSQQEQTLCNSRTGFYWNGFNCVRVIYDEGATVNFCRPGANGNLRLDDHDATTFCYPAPSSCGPEQVPRSFVWGNVSECQDVRRLVTQYTPPTMGTAPAPADNAWLTPPSGSGVIAPDCATAHSNYRAIQRMCSLPLLQNDQRCDDPEPARTGCGVIIPTSEPANTQSPSSAPIVSTNCRIGTLSGFQTIPNGGYFGDCSGASVDRGAGYLGDRSSRIYQCRNGSVHLLPSAQFTSAALSGATCWAVNLNSGSGGVPTSNIETRP